MISVSSVANAGSAGEYYAGDDYYTADGSFGAAQWGGKGAVRANLKGEVTSERLTEIFNGKITKDVDLSVNKQGKLIKRRHGLDMVFSPPKSIQIAIGVLEDKQMLEDHIASVKTTMKYVEEKYAARQQNYKNKKIISKHTGNMLYALVTHRLTRANDPGPHTHVAIANATFDKDIAGWRALDTDPIYKVKSAADAFYLSELHAAITKRGISTDRHNQWGNFELKNISNEAIHLFSKQGNKIKNIVARTGLNTKQARQQYALEVRPNKQAHSAEKRKVMPAGWREEARKAKVRLPTNLEPSYVETTKPGKTLGKISKVLTKWTASLSFSKAKHDPFLLPTDRTKDRYVNNAVSFALRDMSETKATFFEYDVINETIKNSKSGVSGTQILARLEVLKNKGLIIDTSRDNKLGEITTKHALETEKEILTIISSNKGEVSPILSDKMATELLKTTQLMVGQRIAAQSFLTSTSPISAIQGFAGVGKSTMMGGINSVIESTHKTHGLEMFGAAHALTAVEELNKKSGIHTVSLEFFNKKYSNMSKRQAYEERDWSKVIFVLDEASQVGNDTMLTTLRVIQKLKIPYMRTIGDKGQFHSVSAGSPFAAAQKTKDLDTIKLSQILRQRNNKELLKMVHLAANGQAVKAFRSMEKYTTEIEIDNIPDHIARKYGQLNYNGRQNHMIVAPTNDMVDQLNDAVYDESIRKGFVGSRTISVSALSPIQLSDTKATRATSFRRGEQIRFNTVPSKLDYKFFVNRVYSILDKDTSKNTLKLIDDRGRKRTLHLKNFDKSLKGDQAGSLSLYETKTLKLRERALIKWTKTNKSSSQYVGQSATVLSISTRDQTVTVKLQNNQTSVFHVSEPAFRQLKLGYAMTAFKSQGADNVSADIVQTSVMSKSLNAISSYVMASRAELDTQYTVDKIKGVEHRLRSNPVSIDSAFLALSERKQQRAKSIEARTKLQEPEKQVQISDAEIVKDPEKTIEQKPEIQFSTPSR
ncbi:MAG: hypothetical protein COA43_00460 [Robiginitomaculum sp.]|nr:MAG: hypothetical protein COA43_00460 [Robiginitomaculum sp.]